MIDYHKISGWFDFQDVYDQAVLEAGNFAQFVEVGCWMGKSSVYLAQRVLESRKPITLFFVDTWEGSAEDGLDNEAKRLTAEGKSVFEQWSENMASFAGKVLVNPIRKPSTDAAKLFLNASLSFVFIDADHTYPSVYADIRAWLPKMKPGGILAGHDYERDGVCRAVSDTLGKDNVTTNVHRNTWVYRVPE